MATSYTGYSQSTSESEWKSDSLYCINKAQLRKTVIIFAEHSHLLSENIILTNRVSLLERSITAKDYIIQSQREQINTLGDIIVKKDAIILNNNAIIEGLKKQVKAEQKDMKKFWYGAGAGVVVSAVAILIFK